MRKKTVDVAIYLPSLGHGGIERVYLNLAKEFVRRGIRVDLLVAQAKGPRMSEVPSGARLVDFAARGRRMPLLVPGFVRYLRRRRPAALLACSGMNLPAIWFELCSRSAPRTLISVHNHLSTQFANLSLAHRLLLKPLMALSYSRARAIVAVSTHVADDLCRFLHLDRRRVDVIYNPVVTDAMLRMGDDPVEHPWLRDGQPPVILGVGSLIPRKDYTTLLRAFALLHQQCRARLLILGDGEERPRLERLIRELDLQGEVDLAGFVSNPYPYFRRAKLFVLSSRWEGLPTNMIEALAFGCPVVATDCPGGPREILDHGRYGRLVRLGDHEALSQAILETLNDAPDQDVLEARAMDFRVDKIADRYLELMGLSMADGDDGKHFSFATG